MIVRGERARAADVLARFREDVLHYRAASDRGDVERLGALLGNWVLSGRLERLVAAQATEPSSYYRVVPILVTPLVHEGGLRVALLYLTPGMKPSAAAASSLLRDHAENGVLVNAGRGTVRVTAYRQPSLEPRDVLDPAKVLVCDGVRSYGRGEFTPIIAGETVLDLLDVDAPTVLLAAFGSQRYDLSWGYDARTLQPAKLYHSTLRDTRLRYALEVAHNFADWWEGDGHLTDAVERLTRHRSHAVRWSALRALDALDERRGAAALARAVDDPHPHLASAARKALV